MTGLVFNSTLLSPFPVVDFMTGQPPQSSNKPLIPIPDLEVNTQTQKIHKSRSTIGVPKETCTPVPIESGNKKTRKNKNPLNSSLHQTRLL
jgi:hypothetical protein